MAPYVRYTQKVWETVKQSNPDMKMWEITRLINKMWRSEQAEQDRQVYFEEYEQGKNLGKNLSHQKFEKTKIS